MLNYKKLIIILIPFILFIVLLSYNSQQIIQRGLNSDSLYLVSLYKDIVEEQNSIRTWHLTPAPYFYPDMFILFPLLMVTPDYGLALSIYNFFIWLGIFVSIIFIGYNLSRNYFTSYFSGLIFLVLFLAYVSSYGGDNFIRFYFVPSFHFGVVLSGLLILAIVLHIIHEQCNYGLYIALFCISSLTHFSDPLFLVQILLPLCFACIVAGILKLFPFKRLFGIVFIAFLSVLVSYLTLKYIQESNLLRIPGTISTMTAPEEMQRAFTALVSDFTVFFHRNTWFTTFGALSAILGFTICIHLLFRKERNSEAHSLLFLLIFTVSSIVSNILVLVLTGAWHTFSEVRYCLPLFLWSFLSLSWLYTYTHRYINNIAMRVINAVALVMLIILSLPYFGQLALSSFFLPYPKQVQFLDSLAARYGFLHGYGDYWFTKYVHVMSRRGVKVNQLPNLPPPLIPRPWINNYAWYYELDGSYPHYQFIITDRLERQAMLNVFGVPADTYTYEDSEILIYNRPEDVAFRNILKMQVKDHTDTIVYTAPSSPRELAVYRRFTSSSDYPGTVKIPNGSFLTVLFESPAHGNVLEIGADAQAVLTVELYDSIAALESEISILRWEISAEVGQGMFPRFLKWKELSDSSTLSALRIRSISGDTFIGHAFVYPDG